VFFPEVRRVTSEFKALSGFRNRCVVVRALLNLTIESLTPFFAVSAIGLIVQLGTVRWKIGSEQA
jgi:hypothetical protein